MSNVQINVLHQQKQEKDGEEDNTNKLYPFDPSLVASRQTNVTSYLHCGSVIIGIFVLYKLHQQQNELNKTKIALNNLQEAFTKHENWCYNISIKDLLNNVILFAKLCF